LNGGKIVAKESGKETDILLQLQQEAPWVLINDKSLKSKGKKEREKRTLEKKPRVGGEYRRHYLRDWGGRNRTFKGEKFQTEKKNAT